ncbi:MAG: hypothetical protein RLZZ45_861 [Bacteroidota bacterium]
MKDWVNSIKLRLPMRIDAHQHFWNHDPVRHAWIDESMARIRRDFSPGDLAPLLHELAIDGTIAVQADETMEETSFLLGLAQKNDFIKAVVGWVDFNQGDIHETLASLKSHTKLAGFRCIMQGKPDELYLRNTEFIQKLKLLKALDFSYDLLVYHDQMGSLLHFVEKLPENRLILDHIGKPDIKSGNIKEWKDHIRILAQHPGIYCKISGMITEAKYHDWNYDQLIPYMETVAEYFGMDRICFGSDWPVCLVAGNYKQVYDVVDRFSMQLSTEEKRKLFGLNAKDFYKC